MCVSACVCECVDVLARGCLGVWVCNGESVGVCAWVCCCVST